MNISSNWKTYLKFLSRNKGYTAIDLFGLSVSLMFVLLIAVYTWQELSTDQFQANKERIYFVGSESWMATGGAIPYAMKERYPEIEKVCPMVFGQAEAMPVMSGNNKLNADIMFADSTFFDLFSFRLLQGDPKNVLIPTNNAVLSQSFARKLYGTDDVVGRTFSVDTLRYTVAGVMEDIKQSCIPYKDIVLPWRAVKPYNFSLMPDQTGNAAGITCAVLVSEGADLKSKATDMRDWLKTFFWVYERGVEKEVRIEKLADFYFSSNTGYYLNGGDRKFVMVLISVGVLILVFAVLNYINLTVAQAGFRAKEMATRRLLGSTRGELFRRLILESVFMCIMALALAILLSLYAVPYVDDLLQTKLDMSVLLSPQWIVGILGFALLVGGLSGWLPALVISNAKPIEVVRGTLRVKTKMVFSKVFITFQNFITIVMLSCSLVMILQIYHMIHAPLGYETKNLCWINATSLSVSEQQAFRDKLAGIGGVSSVGYTQGLPLFGSNNWTAQYMDGGVKRNISFQQYPMDRNAFEMLGLKMIRDNHLADPYWYVNEEALRQMNLSQDAASFMLDREAPIAISGVTSDFHEGNINSNISAVMLRFMKPDESGWFTLVEIQGNLYETYEKIGAAYREISGGLDMEGGFMDKQLEDSFQSQIRLAKIVGVFTVIAVLISLLGLLAMSTYFIQQRSLEVAVRKVFGSDRRQVLYELVKSFLLYVVIAFIFAVPIAYYFMSDWLADYTYRISLNPLIFIAAGLFCLFISFCTVFMQSWRAANANPVKTMKNL